MRLFPLPDVGERSPLLQIKVGVHLASLKQPFKKALETAARIGADAVEIDARNHIKPSEMTRTAVRHLHKKLSDLNLKVSAVTFQTRRSYSDVDGIEQRVEATKAAMKMAYDLGCHVVVNQIGKVPDRPAEDSESIERNLLIATLSEIGKESQRVGAFLAARTGTEEGATMLDLIDDLPTGSLVVDFDPGNLIINGFSAAEAVKSLGQFIQHVHARDGVQDLAQGRGIEVPLGRGSADFPNLLGNLEEHQYHGYLTVQRDQAEDPISEVANAIEFLKNI